MIGEKFIYYSNESVKEAIIAIGQEIIRKAEDITNDINYVRSITIHSELKPNEIVSVDITKNYMARIEVKNNEIRSRNVCKI